ncbi:sensor histidine kinase [Jiulongibacter sediminis]|uniref:sensor histidine kinase n=1 Tax=Jiulongibacter sediminis TaxID=1605367 RepID=UPI0026EDDF94|nr:sensor histidine kinase [Jiulongibacter sediminis]
MAYTDTALVYYDYVTAPEKYFIYESRAFFFKELNQLDSAYANLEKAIRELVRLQDNESNAEIRKLEEEFQNDKHQETIRNQRLQLILVLTLLVVILIATILFIRKNRLINGQNKIISLQLIELKKTVEQKEILLSELQHRVKNNLQYVISLLEIQKESVGYSSMEDLIRNNQNRIHSIALLHKKLNVDESVDDVELKRYVTDLSELVLESYQQTDKQIDLSITCEVATLPLTKAMPVGLIIVELLSNSMKHAFRNKKEGNIEITISYDHENGLNKLRYQDNGKGFDFENVTTKGLGVEITKGLIDQLDAEIETSTTHGFDLTITF